MPGALGLTEQHASASCTAFRQSCWPLGLALLFILSSCCAGRAFVALCVGDLARIAWNEGASGSERSR